MRACPKCGEANPDRLTACAFCGTALEAATGAQEERKVLTVVFCDLKDSTVLGERLDPEALGEVLDLYFTAMTRVLKRHGGSIEKFIGDAIVAAFGIPVLHEDDALRAVRAAVEMRDALVRLNRQLETAYGVTLVTRTGVHTGEVVVRQAAGGNQVLTGDTMNTTARLEQNAGASEILIGEPTYRLVRGAVEVEAVEPLTLKGKEATVVAYRLRAVVGDEQAARRHLAPFVGRDHELADLVAQFERAADERRCLLATVLGEAGVGKSRLVRALIDTIGPDATVLRGRCLPYGESITFWPLLAIVRDACGIDELDSEAQARVESLTGDPEVARRVASALGWSDEDLPVAELFWGIREFLESVAQAGPVVVVIDDVHWAAPTLLELIEHLLERVTDRTILVVCTARPTMLDTHPTWSEGPDATRLSLGRLPDEVSRRLIANMTGGLEMPPAVTARILEASEGNPLFVEQLVSMLIDRGLLVQSAGRWFAAADLARLEVPPSIHALLSARLDELEAGERLVVNPASVIGLEFSSDTVLEIVPETARAEAPDRLESLVAKHLVREEHTPDEENDYRFDHLLIRDAAYAGVLKRTRADLHERVADWFDASTGRSEREEVIGYHLEQATLYRSQLGPIDAQGRALATRASEMLATAGRRAFARGDLPAAIDLLRRGRGTLPSEDPARIQLVPELAEALLESGEFEAARQVLATGDSAAEDPLSQCSAARGRLVRLLVDFYSDNQEGWAARAEAEVERAIPLFEASRQTVGLATAWRVRYGAQISALQYEVAEGSAEHVVRYAEEADDIRQQRRGSVAYALAVLHGPMPVRRGISVIGELIQSVEGDRSTQAVMMLFLSQLLAMDSRIDEAREEYRRAKVLFDELGDSVLAASTSTDAALVEVMAGDLDEAEALLRRDDADLQALGESSLRSSVLGLLAHVLVRKDEIEDAERAAREAASLASPDDLDAQVDWRSTLARCLAARGDFDGAIPFSGEAVALTDGTTAPIRRAGALTDSAIVLAAAGRAAEAADAATAALEIQDAKGNLVGADEVRRLLASISAA